MSNKEQVKLSFNNSIKTFKSLFSQLNLAVDKGNNEEIKEVLYCCENEVNEMQRIIKRYPLQEYMFDV